VRGVNPVADSEPRSRTGRGGRDSAPISATQRRESKAYNEQALTKAMDAMDQWAPKRLVQAYMEALGQSDTPESEWPDRNALVRVAKGLACKALEEHLVLQLRAIDLGMPIQVRVDPSAKNDVQIIFHDATVTSLGLFQCCEGCELTCQRRSPLIIMVAFALGTAFGLGVSMITPRMEEVTHHARAPMAAVHVQACPDHLMEWYMDQRRQPVQAIPRGVPTWHIDRLPAGRRGAR